ncbi:MAG: hypothetical protein ACFFCZ_14195 [Promethearchaeota archaeon]
MKLSKAVKEAFAIGMAAKFLATRDETGVPNLAMIATVTPWNDEHLIFGNFLMWQTQENLKKGSPVSVTVMTQDFQCWEARGRFLGFESSGEKFNTMSENEIFRYSALGLLRSVGTIAVNEVHPIKMNMLSIGKEWLLTKIAAKRPKDLPEGKTINPVVVKNASVLQGAKFLTVSRNDHLEQFPVMGLKPCNDYLVIRGDLPLKTGDQVAVTTLTMDLKAFQIKGTYSGVRRSKGIKFGYVRVTNVKTQTPPLVSREIPSHN